MQQLLILTVCALVLLAMSGTSAPEQQEQERLPLDWTQLTSYLSKVATEKALDLPPVQQDLSFLRLSLVLAELCHQVYAASRGQVKDISEVELPQAGTLAAPVKVAIKLLHFREASMDRELASPQQYGLWEVQGLGLVLAFRGTASPQDVVIDVNISPEPLGGSFPPGQADIQVHSGFYEGAKKHADDILALVRQQQQRQGHTLPVWVTGHSLGGGYANVLILHLLAQRQGAQLFSAGGGAVTFGAPQVLYSKNPSALYDALSSLESRGWSSRSSRRPANAQLHFHNYVNNADVVPRLLGTSLDSVHDRIQQYVASMQRVRSISQHYHPFGGYHLIVGTQVRTPPPEHVAPEGVAGHMGNTAYADIIRKYLHISVLWKTVYATTAKGGGVLHHSLSSYIANLRSHTDAIAAQTPGRLPNVLIRPHDLFAPRPGLGECPVQSPGRGSTADGTAGGGTAAAGAPSQEFLDELGGLIGQAGKLLINHAAESGWASAGSLSTSAADRWQAYWSKPAAAPAGDQASTAATEASAPVRAGPQTRAAAREQARQESMNAAGSGASSDPQPSSSTTWGDYLTWGYWKGKPKDEL